jgi:3-deoxy-D-manno-octulosonate 8-phosphate phosphatase (KDO 8-P phosphatase)
MMSQHPTDSRSVVPIKLLILDVDGVLTDGLLPYTAQGGDAIKTFFVRDGGAIRLWQSMGGVTGLISGRSSPAVAARAKDVGISLVFQGVKDKIPPYEAMCRSAGVDDDRTAFVGDDLWDLAPMRRCAYPIAVAQAAAVVKRAARYVTRRRGGDGAVAEGIERLLRHNGTWQAAMRTYGVGASSR